MIRDTMGYHGVYTISVKVQTYELFPRNTHFCLFVQIFVLKYNRYVHFVTHFTLLSLHLIHRIIKDIDINKIGNNSSSVASNKTTH